MFLHQLGPSPGHAYAELRKFSPSGFDPSDLGVTTAMQALSDFRDYVGLLEVPVVPKAVSFSSHDESPIVSSETFLRHLFLFGLHIRQPTNQKSQFRLSSAPRRDKALRPADTNPVRFGQRSKAAHSIPVSLRAGRLT